MTDEEAKGWMFRISYEHMGLIDVDGSALTIFRNPEQNYVYIQGSLEPSQLRAIADFMEPKEEA